MLPHDKIQKVTHWGMKKRKALSKAGQITECSKKLQLFVFRTGKGLSSNSKLGRKSVEKYNWKIALAQRRCWKVRTKWRWCQSTKGADAEKCLKFTTHDPWAGNCFPHHRYGNGRNSDDEAAKQRLRRWSGDETLTRRTPQKENC